MLRKICIVRIQPRRPRPSVGHADYSAPTRKHELDHTDHTHHTDHTDHTDQEPIYLP